MARGGAGGGREAVGSPRGAPRNKKIVLAWRRDYQINFRGNRGKSSLLLPFCFCGGRANTRRARRKRTHAGREEFFIAGKAYALQY